VRTVPRMRPPGTVAPMESCQNGIATPPPSAGPEHDEPPAVPTPAQFSELGEQERAALFTVLLEHLGRSEASRTWLALVAGFDASET
jgi:hypothetical protein